MADKKKVTRKKPNAVKRFYRETIGELRKVTWPTRQEAINLTVIVLIVVFSMAALLGTVDYMFNELIAWIIA